MWFHHHIHSLSNKRLNVMIEQQARQPEVKARKFLLLALAGAQLRYPAPARKLCTSTWFRLARAYAESQDCPWLLLSAKYGLVNPTEVISPYQLDVTHMGVRQRTSWAQRIGDQARRKLPYSEQIVLVAGMKYCDCLLPHLSELAEQVYTPLAGLSVGFQCGWLRCHTPRWHHSQE